MWRDRLKRGTMILALRAKVPCSVFCGSPGPKGSHLVRATVEAALGPHERLGSRYPPRRTSAARRCPKSSGPKCCSGPCAISTTATALLDQLAHDRLAAVAGEVRAESQAVDLGEVLADQSGLIPICVPCLCKPRTLPQIETPTNVLPE
jgi:hypothetical protein